MAKPKLMAGVYYVAVDNVVVELAKRNTCFSQVTANQGVADIQFLVVKDLPEDASLTVTTTVFVTPVAVATNTSEFKMTEQVENKHKYLKRCSII